jgi:hypothetical protein
MLLVPGGVMRAAKKFGGRLKHMQEFNQLFDDFPLLK